MELLPSFPVPAASHAAQLVSCVPSGFAERNLGLRFARDTDIAWMRDLYASTREEELRFAPWSPAAKRVFTDSQFDLQHRHYVQHFADAHFLVIEQHRQPIGRHYVLLGSTTLIVDICLVPERRGQGIGSALLKHVAETASCDGAQLELHVHNHNVRAISLYKRLGFGIVEQTPTHLRMRISRETSRLS